MGKDEIVRVCYEWRVNNLKFGSYSEQLSEKLNKIGLAGIYLARPKRNSVSRICKQI
jgi:hypothetical protein